MATKAIIDEEHGLIERDAELALAQAMAVDAAAGRGGLIVVEAAAGIGKSSFLAVLAGQAERAGLRLLTSAGGELEAAFPFGVARQLFEPALRAVGQAEREELLAGSAALAAPLFPVGGGADGNYPDADAVAHGLYWLASNLAEERPLALFVDDAHWCDAPTMRALHYLSRRVEGLPVLLVLGARPAEHGPARDLLERIAVADETALIKLAPLSVTGGGTLVSNGLGSPDEAFARAVHEATGGNPFYLRELLRALADEGVAPDAANVHRVTAVGPRTVARSVQLRLDGIGPDAHRLARAVAVLGQDAPLLRAALLADIEPAEAARVADALAEAEVFRTGRPLSFVHAIVRAAIRAQMTPSERSSLHARAARMLVEQGEEDATIALHLLEVEPAGDGELVAHLQEAADQAFAQGAVEVAATYLERALAEPPAREDRSVVLLSLAHAEHRLLRDNHLDRLHEAMEAQADPALRASVARELVTAMGLAGSWREAIKLADAEMAAVQRLYPELAARLDVAAVEVGRMAHDARADVVRRLERLEAFRDDQGLAWLIEANHARELGTSAAPVEQTLAAARRALELAPPPEDRGVYEGAYCIAVITLIQADAIDEGIAAAEGMLEDARERGNVHGFALASQYRALACLRAGRLAEAEADARQSLATLSGWEFIYPQGIQLLSDCLIERGELQESAALLGTMEEEPAGTHYTNPLGARARLRALQGNWEGALADARRVGRNRLNDGQVNPAMAPWRSMAAIALLNLGRREEALELTSEEVTLARQGGAQRAVGIALRAHGVVVGGEEGLALLTESVEVLKDSPAELEYARSLCEMGAAIRRVGRRAAARDPLREAADIAARCGATVVANRAREELLASGARPRRTALKGIEALTPSERRVCELATEGLTNREIAQALFVTVKTIEDHLRNSYGKLGVAGKKDLPDALREA